MDNCYLLQSTHPITWGNAEKKCIQENAHLVSILHQNEMNFLHDLLMRKNVFNTGAYIGRPCNNTLGCVHSMLNT
jgi:hypothetical protein